MENISRDDFGRFFNKFLVDNKVPVRGAAKAIGCSGATMERILGRETKPTDAMMKQGCVMMELGIRRYTKLSKVEKEKISEALGTIGGGVLGFSSVSAAVSAYATVTAWGGAVITSGLAGIGGLVGGGLETA